MPYIYAPESLYFRVCHSPSATLKKGNLKTSCIIEYTMPISEARKRANEKWRKAHLDYFNDWMKNKYANDPVYREKCKSNVKRYREQQKEIKGIMKAEYLV